MSVIVFGASSQIGQPLLSLLSNDGTTVHAVGRAPRPSRPGVHWLQGALPGAVPPLPPADGLACFGPLDKLAAWLATLEAAPAPVLVATGSMSIDSKRDSPIDDDRRLVAVLEAAEAGIARECARLGIAWTLLRPTLVYGRALDRSLTPLARRAQRWRVFPLPAATGLRQPVHAADVAEAALRALRTPAAHGRVFEIGGGERLAAGAMFARVRASLPVATMPLPLPAPLLALVARCWPRARGPVRRLGHDLVADNRALEAVLGLRPRGFAPDPGCWQPPGR